MKLKTATLLLIAVLFTGTIVPPVNALESANGTKNYIQGSSNRKLSKEVFNRMCLVYKEGYSNNLKQLSQGELSIEQELDNKIKDSLNIPDNQETQVSQDALEHPPVEGENTPPKIEKPNVENNQIPMAVKPKDTITGNYPQLMTMKQVVGNTTKSRLLPNKNLNIYKNHIDMRRFKAQLNVDVVRNSPYVERYYKNNAVSPIDILDNSKTPTGTFLTIDKSKRILTIYKDRAVLYKFPVSLGRPGSPTPTMKTKITLKAINPAWGGMNGKCTPIRGGAPNNPLGHRWLSTGYRGGGIIGIHGTLSHNTIGTYESAGCIRMTNHDVETYVYPSVPVGSSLYIGTTKELENWGVRQIVEKVSNPEADLKRVKEMQEAKKPKK